MTLPATTQAKDAPERMRGVPSYDRSIQGHPSRKGRKGYGKRRCEIEPDIVPYIEGDTSARAIQQTFQQYFELYTLASPASSGEGRHQDIESFPTFFKYFAILPIVTQVKSVKSS